MSDSNAETDHHAFWADEIADRIEARDPDDPIVIKGAVSPSGVPHIGHMNEILRGYYVAEVLRERGRTVTQLFVSDDRDALRSVPRRLADADWNLVGLDEVDAGALGRNLGVPYTDIPDPFGDCHGSYGEHFTALLRESAERLGVPLEVRSTTELYETGAFDEVIRLTLDQRERATALLSEFQDSVPEHHVPFMPICERCGKQLTTRVTEVDSDLGGVSYECGDVSVADSSIQGCGHVGWGEIRQGKLPWRFEWPAGWRVLGVDFEPFGKDHAEGSWPSGQRIASDLYDTEPPIPMVYEWFTLDGEALSSSAGNVVTVPSLLELVGPEVIRQFFVRNPRKQRDLSVAHADELVDAFDRFEALFMGERTDPDLGPMAERAYPFVMPPERVPASAVETAVDAGILRTHPHEMEGRSGRYEEYREFLRTVFERRVRLRYTYAAVLGMADEPQFRETMARRSGYLAEDDPEWVVVVALERVPRARRWAERMDNEYNYRLETEAPALEISNAMEAALHEVADVVEQGADGDSLQTTIYEAADRHDVPVGELFATGYRLFLGTDSGPRLGPFLAALDQEFATNRLRAAR